jgi:hypothetical protein
MRALYPRVWSSSLHWSTILNKKEVITKLIYLENPSIDKCFARSKITLSKLIDTVALPSYNLSKELGMTATGVTKLVARCFPNKPKSNVKICSWLLQKYGYKHCVGCDNTFILNNDYFYTNKSTINGFSGYCKSCMDSATGITQKARTAKYRAAKLNRTPQWADLDAIEDFYNNCPIGYHVDHEIPLQGCNVSGLHVLNNLQYLTAKENLEKHNKHDRL